MTVASSSSGPVVRHLRGLDGLRGIAIAMVVMMHVSSFLHTGGPRLLDRVAASVAMGAWRGVDLFFVLSGFLITGIILDSRGGVRFLRNFYARRALRIFPLYYVYLFVYFIVLPATIALRNPEVLGQGWFWTYTANNRLAVTGWAPLSYVQHFWSLCVEEQFYLVWPFIVLGCSERILGRVCVGMAVCAFIVRWLLVGFDLEVAAFTLMPARMDGLAVGAWVALLVRGGASWTVIAGRARSVAIVAGLACVVLLAGFSGRSPAIHSGSTSLFVICSGALVALVACTPTTGRANRVLSSALLRTLGKYSYGMYVFQQAVIIAVEKCGFDMAKQPKVLGFQFPMLIVDVVGLGGVTFAIAVLSWNVIEKPALRLRRYFENKEVDMAEIRFGGS